jgi:hypothetical protein
VKGGPKIDKVKTLRINLMWKREVNCAYILGSGEDAK